MACWRAGLRGTSAGRPARRLAGESGVEERLWGEFGKCVGGEGGGGRRRSFDCHFHSEVGGRRGKV